MTVTVVIGANWGDEGKGNVTSRFCGLDTLNVRFNGGAQASHTVVSGKKRHAFSHFGSGTMKGAKTLLTREFVLNPIAFDHEVTELFMKSISVPRIYAHASSPITTIYDIMYNRAVEKARGDKNHGSCGMGFNATLKRHPLAPVTLSNSGSDADIAHSLKWVKQVYDSNTFLNTLPDGSRFDPSEAVSDGVLALFIDDLKRMRDSIDIVDDKTTASILSMHDHVVFEGAQGLALDQNSIYFPHVTPSNTGSKNIMKENGVLLDFMMKQDHIEVVYVTRPYLTKHGAGPFHDDPVLINSCFDIVDETNVPNDWQGSIRLARLDLDGMFSRIENDFENFSSIDRDRITATLAVTCMDQMRTPSIPIVSRGNFMSRYREINETFDTTTLIKWAHGHGFDRVLLGISPDGKFLPYARPDL